ncbi:hypothetical protein [Microbacterium sp. A84]|uniref:hypothetical protein n=1 Tax=Microbacterium sp. A84 TaxID=3450715 RepID=UPI003F43EE93
MIKKSLTAAAVAASAFLFVLGGTSSAMAADNLVENGGFDAPGFDANGGEFWLGEDFGAWEMTGQKMTDEGPFKTMRVYYPAMGEPERAYGAPYVSGPWSVLTGGISQTIATVPDTVYSVTFDTRRAGWNPGVAEGWDRSNPGQVLIDGAPAYSFATPVDDSVLISAQSFVFKATGTSTVLTFDIPQLRAVGLDNVSVTEAPINDSPIMIPAIAGGIGIAALGAGSAFAISRKNKRAGQ